MIALAACGNGADAPRPAPHSVSAALRVAGGTACHVELVQVSYDDPSADDEERIVLRAAGDSGSHPGSDGPGPGEAEHDGGFGSEAPCGLAGDGGDEQTTGGDAGGAGDEGSQDLTLGACGLDRIELVNGSSDECPVYRTLELSDVPIPEDGYVTVCSGDSTLAAAGGCDVSTAGNAALANGWIQNGPNDALRFVARGGETTAVSYEGGTCVGPDAWILAEEAGAIDDGSGAEVDDINLWCSDGFVLASASDVPLRGGAACPSPPAGDAGASLSSRDDGGRGEAAGPSEVASESPDATAPSKEVVPSQDTGTASQRRTGSDLPVLPRADAGRLSDFAPDGGNVVAQGPPSPPACSLSRPGARAGAVAGWLAALGLLGWSSRRHRGLRQRERAGAAQVGANPA